MKAMLDPRMVPVSIHVLDSAGHGTAAPADRMTASSHGIFIEIWMSGYQQTFPTVTVPADGQRV
jgi:hypothetical protein